MHKGRVFLTIVLVSMVGFIQGCVVAAVGAGAAGTVAYIRGDLEAVESEDIHTVYSATKKAVDQLGLSVLQDSKDALSAVIVARDAQDKKITITLKSAADRTTKVSIRVGMFGSETKSRQIYQKIHDNLR